MENIFLSVFIWKYHAKKKLQMVRLVTNNELHNKGTYSAIATVSSNWWVKYTNCKRNVILKHLMLRQRINAFNFNVGVKSCLRESDKSSSLLKPMLGALWRTIKSALMRRKRVLEKNSAHNEFCPFLRLILSFTFNLFSLFTYIVTCLYPAC